MDLTHEEMHLIHEQLDNGATPEQAADALNRYRALQAVERVLSMRRSQSAQQQITRDSFRYRFVAPAALLSPDEAKERHYDPSRKAHKEFIVTLADFPAFCDSFGLDQGQMVRLWNGDIQSYKGWRASNNRWANRQDDREIDELNRSNQERVKRYVSGSVFAAVANAESRKPLKFTPEKWSASE